MSKVKARVLSQFADAGTMVWPNTLVSGDESVINALHKAGTVDRDKSAVDYCKGQDVVEIIGDGVDFVPEKTAEELAAEKAASEKAAAIKAAEDNLQAANKSLAAAKSDKDKEAAQNLVNEAQAALDALTK